MPYIFFFILFLVGILVGYWQLGKLKADGTYVSYLASVLIILSFLMKPGDSAELNLLVGLLRIGGIVGILLAIVAGIRNKFSPVPPDSEPKTQRVRPNSNKCLQCGLINGASDPLCKRCGAPLKRRRSSLS